MHVYPYMHIQLIEKKPSDGSRYEGDTYIHTYIYTNIHIHIHTYMYI